MDSLNFTEVNEYEIKGWGVFEKKGFVSYALRGRNKSHKVKGSWSYMDFFAVLQQ